MKRFFAVLMAVICFLSANNAQAAQTIDTPAKVRVGYFAFSSFQEVDENGNFKGYGYEYLQEIAKYTGWEYEYVFAGWDECLDLLERGEIDLLGSAQHTEERALLYDYPKLDSGISYAVLCAPSHNNELAYEDFAAFEGMKVGLLKGNSRNDTLEDYCRDNNFTVRTQEYEDQKELLDALHTGNVDTILTSNLRKDDNERIVARFAPSPFYFITNKGNTAVMDKLNYAQTQIKLANPYFDSELYQKYYGVETADQPVFTQAEHEYIKQNPLLRVTYKPHRDPLEGQDAETGAFTGITADIFESIRISTRFEFEFTPVSDYGEASEMLMAGKADLISGVNKNYTFSPDVAIMMTNSYLSSGSVIVTNPMGHSKETKIGVTADFLNAMGKKAVDEAVLMEIYPTTEDCFKSLRQGRISAVYTNVYEADMQRRDSRFTGFQTTSLPSLKEELCAAVSRYEDPLLLSILNKTIFYLSEEELQDIVIKNTSLARELTLQDYIYQNPMGAIAISSSILLIIILFLCYAAFLRNKSNKQAFRLLYLDDLTGIWNFNHFLQQMKRLLAMDKKTRYAMVYMDIEHFKNFNDTYGYEEGDRILRTVAEIIKDSLDQDELYARMSNDNFVALMKYQGEASFILRLTLIQGKLSSISGNHHGGQRLIFTSGIYVIRDSDQDAAHIVDCANDARKTVKGMHKSTFAFFSNQLQKELLEKREIESVMEKALDSGQFIPFFQPKVDLITSKIVGAEALVRWHHPERGLVPPDSFVPLFEKNGFIVEMDFYIFECVCQTLHRHIEEGREPVPISSNFSKIHLKRPGFISRLKEVVSRYQVPEHLLELEITESMMDEDSDLVMSVLNELRSYGFQISMDDFGSGYSSLNSLKNMPIDILKMDKEFLQKGILSEKDRIIIEGFVDIAKKLRIKVICEGVETQEQVAFLKSIGCELGQGYLFARPMPLNDFESMMFD